MMTLSKPPAAKANLLVRANAQACFNAFVDPAITTRFWFTKSSGNSDFKGDGDSQGAAAIASIGGWCFVLAGLKAWLEHAIALNLVDDKWPDKYAADWKGCSS